MAESIEVRCGGEGGGRGGMGSDGDTKDVLLRRDNGVVARIPAPCRLLAAVEDEDGGPSGLQLHKNAVECQRVRICLGGGWSGRRFVWSPSQEQRLSLGSAAMYT